MIRVAGVVVACSAAAAVAQAAKVTARVSRAADARQWHVVSNG
jgi:hypothetical protein